MRCLETPLSRLNAKHAKKMKSVTLAEIEGLHLHNNAAKKNTRPPAAVLPTRAATVVRAGVIAVTAEENKNQGSIMRATLREEVEAEKARVGRTMSMIARTTAKRTSTIIGIRQTIRTSMSIKTNTTTSTTKKKSMITSTRRTSTTTNADTPRTEMTSTIEQTRMNAESRKNADGKNATIARTTAEKARTKSQTKLIDTISTIDPSTINTIPSPTLSNITTKKIKILRGGMTQETKIEKENVKLTRKDPEIGSDMRNGRKRHETTRRKNTKVERKKGKSMKAEKSTKEERRIGRKTNIKGTRRISTMEDRSTEITYAGMRKKEKGQRNTCL